MKYPCNLVHVPLPDEHLFKQTGDKTRFKSPEEARFAHTSIKTAYVKKSLRKKKKKDRLSDHACLCDFFSDLDNDDDDNKQNDDQGMDCDQSQYSKSHNEKKQTNQREGSPENLVSDNGDDISMVANAEDFVPEKSASSSIEILENYKASKSRKSTRTRNKNSRNNNASNKPQPLDELLNWEDLSFEEKCAESIVE